MPKTDYEEIAMIITENDSFTETVNKIIGEYKIVQTCLPSEVSNLSTSDRQVIVAILSLEESDNIDELKSNIKHLQQKDFISVLVLSKCLEGSRSFEAIKEITAIRSFPPDPKGLIYWLTILFWKLTSRKQEEEDLQAWSNQMGIIGT